MATLGCPKRSGGYSFIETRTYFWGPEFNVSTTGNHTIGMKWHMVWNATWNISGVAAGSAMFNISLFGDIWDNTTSNWVIGGGTRSNVVPLLNLTAGCPLGSTCYSSGAKHHLITFVAPLTAGDQYLFFTGVFTEIYLTSGKTCTGPGCLSSSLAAELNMASGGNGARSVELAVK